MSVRWLDDNAQRFRRGLYRGTPIADVARTDRAYLDELLALADGADLELARLGDNERVAIEAALAQPRCGDGVEES